MAADGTRAARLSHALQWRATMAALPSPPLIGRMQ